MELSFHKHAILRLRQMLPFAAASLATLHSAPPFPPPLYSILDAPRLFDAYNSCLDAYSGSKLTTVNYDRRLREIRGGKEGERLEGREENRLASIHIANLASWSKFFSSFEIERWIVVDSLGKEWKIDERKKGGWGREWLVNSSDASPATWMTILGTEKEFRWKNLSRDGVQACVQMASAEHRQEWRFLSTFTYWKSWKDT